MGRRVHARTCVYACAFVYTCGMCAHLCASIHIARMYIKIYI